MRIPAITLFASLAALCACRSTVEYPYMQTDEILARERIEPDFQIAYGEDERQFGHLRLPEGPGPHPLLIVIHGGCWKAGISLRYLDSFCEEMTAAGLATWNIEYRSMSPDTTGWPDLFLDVGAAVDAVPEFASEHALDLDRVIVAGHSAGGQLALWVAGRHRIAVTSDVYRADPLPVHGTVCIDGMGDLESYGAYQRGGCTDSAVDQLMGGNPQQVPERYAAVSPLRLLPFGVPQRMLTGSLDVFVPPPTAEEYAELARRFGDDAIATVLEDSGHFEGIVPEKPAFVVVRAQILELFDM